MWKDWTPETKLKNGQSYYVQDNTLSCDCCGIQSVYEDGSWWHYGSYLSLSIRSEIKNVRRYTEGPLKSCTDKSCPCCDEIDAENDVQIEPECKGLVYRLRIASYIDSHQIIRHRQSLFPLRRLSCKGCGKCEHLRVTLEMCLDSITIDPNAKHDDMVKLVGVGTYRDGESNVTEPKSYMFRKVLP